jgi:hypothetical protein
VSPTTVVRFRDVMKQADYRETHRGREHALPHVSDGFLAAHAGQEVRIYIAPRIPFVHGCGVERVWAVPADEVTRLTGAPPPYGEVVVCEHQVEID